MLSRPYSFCSCSCGWLCVSGLWLPAASAGGGSEALVVASELLSCLCCWSSPLVRCVSCVVLGDIWHGCDAVQEREHWSRSASSRLSGKTAVAHACRCETDKCVQKPFVCQAYPPTGEPCFHEVAVSGRIPNDAHKHTRTARQSPRNLCGPTSSTLHRSVVHTLRLYCTLFGCA